MASTIEANRPPRWDLHGIYTSLDGEDYTSDFAKLEKGLADAAALFDRMEIRRREQVTDTDGVLFTTLETVLTRMNGLLVLKDTLEAFVYALMTTDSYNTAAAREVSKLELLDTQRQTLDVRLRQWIGSIGSKLPALFERGGHVESHRFFLTFTAEESKYLMDEAQERLAAELCVNSGLALSKLQGNVTSQLKALWERDGKQELTPITVIRNLSYDPDPAVRERAYRTEVDAWKSIRTTVAACLNGVKGTAITLAKHRHRPNVLHAALEQNRIDQATLEALLSAIQEAYPVFRRYLKAKAKALGKNTLPWWDLFAPLGAATRRFSYGEARDFIIKQFSLFDGSLAKMTERAFNEGWIDAEPRDGKRGGAFCMGVLGREENRVLINFDGSFDNVSTLAHELGHAFHNECQRGLEPLRRGSPMTLAETASIFCETLVAQGALAVAEPMEQLMVLEHQLSSATQVCLDISSRYLFETNVMAAGAKGELSADEFCEMIVAAQRDTYADAIDEATYHPYMWLWKPHYYDHNLNFYNFPYAFGHLFALGLYAQFKQQGASMAPKYRQLLRDTGQDYAAPLAARFGIDITKPDFWRQSLGVIAAQVEQLEKLASAR